MKKWYIITKMFSYDSISKSQSFSEKFNDSWHLTLKIEFESQILSLICIIKLTFTKYNNFLWVPCWFLTKILTNFDPTLEKFHNRTEPYIHNIVENFLKYDVPYVCLCLIKFIYSEKATKFCEIFTLLLTGTT